MPVADVYVLLADVSWLAVLVVVGGLTAAAFVANVVVVVSLAVEYDFRRPGDPDRTTIIIKLSACCSTCAVLVGLQS